MAVIEKAKDLMRNYEKCPQYPENVTIRPRYLDALRTALVNYDEALRKLKENV